MVTAQVKNQYSAPPQTSDCAVVAGCSALTSSSLQLVWRLFACFSLLPAISHDRKGFLFRDCIKEQDAEGVKDVTTSKTQSMMTPQVHDVTTERYLVRYPFLKRYTKNGERKCSWRLLSNDLTLTLKMPRVFISYIYHVMHPLYQIAPRAVY